MCVCMQEAEKLVPAPLLYCNDLGAQLALSKLLRPGDDEPPNVHPSIACNLPPPTNHLPDPTRRQDREK